MKTLLLAFSACALLSAQEKVDETTAARIKSEEAEHSQLMRTLHMLTDRYGPRVTGTPNHEAAAKFLVGSVQQVGLQERSNTSRYVLYFVQLHCLSSPLCCGLSAQYCLT